MQHRSDRRLRAKKGQPTEPPTGRMRRRRVAATSTGKSGITSTSGNRYVEDRLGRDPTGADFNPAYCLARSKNHKQQCGKRPVRGRKTCASHGGGSPVRVRRGEIPSPEDKGRGSQGVQAMRALLRTKKPPITLDPFVEHLDEFKARETALRDAPEKASLEEDALQLTALKDLILNGTIEMEAPQALRAVAGLIDTKSQTLVRKHQIEVRDYVPGLRVREIISALVDIIREHVPEDRLETVAKKLRLLAPSATLTVESMPTEN